MALAPVVPPAVAAALDWDAEVKSHLRLGNDEERGRIESVLVPAATIALETYTGRAFVTQTWRLHLDAFPGGDAVIRVPKPPLQSVTHVKYLDTDGTWRTLDPARYIVSPRSGLYALPGLVTPAYADYWPVTRGQVDAIEIQFVCGYGDHGADVPSPLRAAMLIHVGEQFERREEVITGTIVQEVPLTSRILAHPFRVMRFAA